MTRQQIEIMIAGLDGVTPGPWVVEGLNRWHNFSVAWKPELKVCQTYGDSIAAEADAAHLSRCDPSTIRALCELALRGLEAEADAWARVEEDAAIRKAIGDRFILVPPDGGNVPTLEAVKELRAENEKLTRAMRNIKPYLVWTVGPESPGYHPTMPSAVQAFLGALEREPE